MLFRASGGRVGAESRHASREASTLPYKPWYCFVPPEAEADPKLYNTIKGVGLGLGLDLNMHKCDQTRILVRNFSQVGSAHAARCCDVI